ncbi:ABC transporter permease [Halogeometricum borinquense]|uniref:ABC transporter permease n=1 Tax=Halogeometricum borinquense TaxID=60847 RepID=A0A6C0ULH6_9EURY|nr:ABC transporter permease [Halogeometricum borinquense]QIB76292.1 ABC transporter permease [Halogeometricum borinquense]QIQ75274.1 ABC transporter permease [Halogeometricum borinquense]
MTWQAVARKEFDDSIRSRWLHGATTFFVLFVGGAALLAFGFIYPDRFKDASNLFGFFLDLGIFSLSFPGLLALILGFIALSTSYGSITEERETGTMKLSLSLPNSRRDLIVGKLLGRGAVVIVGLLAGFLAAFVAMVATGTGISYGSFVPMIALTVLLAFAFVSIGLGISAVADTNREATLATLGLYLIFGILWKPIAEGIPKLLNYVAEQAGMGALENVTRVKIGLFLKYLNPLRTYETLSAQVYYGAARGRLLGATTGETLVIEPVLKQGIPPYLSGAAMMAILLAWIVVPAVVGYYVFQKQDL